MSTGLKSKLTIAACGAVAALAIGTFTAPPASAQGIFDTLFGGNSRIHDREPRNYGRSSFGRQDWGSDRPQRPMGYAPSTDESRYPFPSLRARPTPERRVESAPPRSSGVHCVRLCDGRYFPLPRGVNGARLDPVKVCSALCPAAKTQVFNGGNMEHAVASDGTRYADLDEAFTFREKVVPDCSCTGQGSGGLAQIDVESDPTLRVGDVVVTADGPTVFRGSNHFPYRSADFSPVGDYGRVNAQLRQKLSDMKVNNTVAPVLPPQKIAAASESNAGDAKPAARQQRRRVVRTRTAAETTAARTYYQQPPQFQTWWR